MGNLDWKVNSIVPLLFSCTDDGDYTITLVADGFQGAFYVLKHAGKQLGRGKSTAECQALAEAHSVAMTHQQRRNSGDK